MTEQIQIHITELQKHCISQVNLDDIMDYFNTPNYTDIKSSPYATTRQISLVPANGIHKIDLVYVNNTVSRVKWYFPSSILDLSSWLGTPRLQYVMHGESTSIGFFNADRFTGFEIWINGEVKQHKKGFKVSFNEHTEILPDIDTDHLSFNLEWYIGTFANNG